MWLCLLCWQSWICALCSHVAQMIGSNLFKPLAWQDYHGHASDEGEGEGGGVRLGKRFAGRAWGGGGGKRLKKGSGKEEDDEEEEAEGGEGGGKMRGHDEQGEDIDEDALNDD